MPSKFLRLNVVLLSSVLVRGAENTSTVTIDWSALTTGQQACVAPGAAAATATLALKNANVILYTYSLNVRNHQIPSNDAGNVPPTESAQQKKAATDCDSYLAALKSLWEDYRLFPNPGRQVALEETQFALNNDTVKGNIKTVVDNWPTACRVPAELQTADAEVAPTIQFYQTKAQNVPSEIDFQYQVDNKHWQDFKLVERARYSGKNSGTSLKWNCGSDDVLTLSLGTLASHLANRTYDHQTIPTATGTQDALVVNSNSAWSPLGVALLNYKLHVWDVGPEPGLALSTGPAFKFGSSPQVTSFGWFAGGSISVWRRFFVSAGVHFGQFADFPPGFTPGATIPANFGTLTPTTRWSGRLALGLSFQTNAFVKSDQSTPTSTAKMPQ